MKKTILIFIITALLSGVLQAQQAKQKRMLLLQIAALRTYVDYAAKGYKAVKNGLNFISDAKKGEVNLHGDYFTSLLSINPKVRNYTRVAEIVSLQVQILKTYKRTFIELQKDDLFHGSELDYIERTFRRLLESCDESIDTLLLITTSTKLQMKDDERIERIDKLYETAREDYAFCEKFSGEIKVLALSKAKEKNDSRQSGELYGL
ncbi:hypothetical protein NLG42_10740 [Flavobacterium plurextorum]|uniref:hypothetical protein n=1 Tax=Flavobacterium TaxID=237 RepID=UPI00214D20DF|nr:MULTISPECIES: hypothetical protein [Flavobacterium]UUW11264.1 hypothetical protein NLG42_10740 [Flavobacterium plurextorum]